MFSKIVFNEFTVFTKLEIPFSPGINVFIGENGTGKTHILKALYASADITTSAITQSFADKINRVFLPSESHIGRLVHRKIGRKKGSIEVYREGNGNQLKIKLEITNMMKNSDSAKKNGTDKLWLSNPVESVYIPVKEMLSNAPGFKSEYENKKLAFEEIYPDIISRALRPVTRGTADQTKKQLTKILQKAIDGNVLTKGEEFFLKNKQGNLEFTLLAEGFRKLGLLSILIQNGTLASGSVLFWDEPETNLNPKLIKTVIEILIKLQQMGMQIFISTHNYVVLKWFNLLSQKEDKILYHSLFREDNEIKIHTTDNYDLISPNAIDEVFGDIIDEEITKDMGNAGK